MQCFRCIVQLCRLDIRMLANQQAVSCIAVDLGAQTALLTVRRLGIRWGTESLGCKKTGIAIGLGAAAWCKCNSSDVSAVATGPGCTLRLLQVQVHEYRFGQTRTTYM